MKMFIAEMLSKVAPKTYEQIVKKREKKELDEWHKNGCPAPPPHVIKQEVIAEYHQKSGYQTLVETGTYLGDMIEAQKNRFKKIYSIELSQKLFKKAQKKFKNDHNVQLIQGDSGKMLSSVVKELEKPAIFFLDGHYSGGITAKGEKECPIFEELDAILDNDSNFNHILLVDDARCFSGNRPGYPTIDKLTKYISEKNKSYKVEVKHDVIRYTI